MSDNDHRTYEVGPDHETVSLDNLPSAGTSRWSARSKAQVVGAVEEGLLTFDEAGRRYKLSIEEFMSWHRALYHHGVKGLRATGGRLSDVAGPRRLKTRKTGRPEF